MSTPSASGAPKLLQNATTPQSFSYLTSLSSPAGPPRSVPSPATAQRHQAGKSSPFNNAASQIPSTVSSHTAQNHPTTASTASGGPTRLLDASPLNLPNFGSPVGMISSLSNLSFSDALGIPRNTSGMGGMGGMGGLQATSSMGGRIDDQERHRRLEMMVARLRSVSPRLSPLGVEIVSQRLGLDSIMDPPNRARKDGTRTCYVAGEAVAVEVSSHHLNKWLEMSSQTDASCCRLYLLPISTFPPWRYLHLEPPKLSPT
jgi:hypothetical protein